MDGFNLYHAIAELRAPELKWLDLWSLLRRYAAQPHQHLTAVYYFSAFATWLPDPYRRHREYVAALDATGVTTVMGHFKNKDRWCANCRKSWVAHEEKETDVNIGLYAINQAHKNNFDFAFLVSNDSDLAPVVRMLRAEFPSKRVRILTPPGRRTSKELMQAAGGPSHIRTIKPSRLRDHLLPASLSKGGAIVARRPVEYDP